MLTEDRVLERAGFGGGCHWCTEGVFQALKGVSRVDQGFIRSEPPADTWAEGVIVTFDPGVISLATLSEVHLRTHSSARARSPRSKYRTAIYVFGDPQRQEVDPVISAFADEIGKPVQTQVLPFSGFRPSDARFQNYSRTDPNRPFCRRYIDPKLNFIRRKFAEISLPPAS